MPFTGKDIDVPISAADSRVYEKQTRLKHDTNPDNGDAPLPTPTLSDVKWDQFSSDAFFPWDSTPFAVDSDTDPFSYSAAASSESMDSYMESTSLDSAALLTPASFDGIGTLVGGLYQDPTPLEAISSAPSPPPAPVCSNHSADKSQDCMSLAITTLQSLHMAPLTCSLASCSPGKVTFSLDPTIEHVLATNRAVLDSVNVILSCYCSLNAQLALVLTLIGSKLIAWCRAVLQNDDRSLQDSMFGRTEVMAERVLHLPVTVGNYNLEGADMGKMQAQLVLSELRHVVRLVEQLAKHFGDDGPGIRVAPGETGKSGNKSVTPLCEQLQILLKEGVQSVTKEAIRILRDS